MAKTLGDLITSLSDSGMTPEQINDVLKKKSSSMVSGLDLNSDTALKAKDLQDVADNEITAAKQNAIDLLRKKAKEGVKPPPTIDLDNPVTKKAIRDDVKKSVELAKRLPKVDTNAKLMETLPESEKARTASKFKEPSLNLSEKLNPSPVTSDAKAAANVIAENDDAILKNFNDYRKKEAIDTFSDPLTKNHYATKSLMGSLPESEAARNASKFVPPEESFSHLFDGLKTKPNSKLIQGIEFLKNATKNAGKAVPIIGAGLAAYEGKELLDNLKEKGSSGKITDAMDVTGDAALMGSGVAALSGAGAPMAIPLAVSGGLLKMGAVTPELIDSLRTKLQEKEPVKPVDKLKERILDYQKNRPFGSNTESRPGVEFKVPTEDMLREQQSLARGTQSFETPSRMNTAQDYIDYAKQLASVNGYDPNHLMAMFKQESNFNPSAISKTGAYGLGQMFPEAFEDVKRAFGDKYKDFTYEDLKNPKNWKLQADAAVDYLNVLKQRLGTSDFSKLMEHYYGGTAGAKGKYGLAAQEHAKRVTGIADELRSGKSLIVPNSPLKPVIGEQPQQEQPAENADQKQEESKQNPTSQQIQDLLNAITEGEKGFTNNTVEDYKKARELADRNLAGAGMLEGANKFGAAIIGATAGGGIGADVKADPNIAKTLKENAEQPVKTWEQATETEKNDPQSTYSVNMRRAVSPLLESLGVKVEGFDRLSAAQIASIAPVLIKQYDSMLDASNVKLKLQEKQESAADKLDEKDTNQVIKLGERVTRNLSSARGTFAKAVSLNLAAERAQTLFDKFATGEKRTKVINPGTDKEQVFTYDAGFDKLTGQEAHEIAKVLDAMLSMSNPTISGTEALKYKSIKSKINDLKLSAKNVPIGAELGAFIQRQVDLVKRERDTAKKQIARFINAEIDKMPRDLYNRRKDDFENLRQQLLIQTTEQVLDRFGNEVDALHSKYLDNPEKYSKGNFNKFDASDKTLQNIGASDMTDDEVAPNKETNKKTSVQLDDGFEEI